MMHTGIHSTRLSHGRWPTMPILLALTGVLLGLPGCASKPASYAEEDPLEPVNRTVHGFNTFIDKVMLKPLAMGYNELIPDPVQTGVSNVYTNLVEPTNAINHVFQGEPRMAGNATGRFAINSTLGILGIFDVAGNANFYPGSGSTGLRSQEEDFAQTLAVWGVPAGPYIVLPFLGPSTLRDTLALGVDATTNPMFHLKKQGAKDKLLALRIVDLRASLLPLDATIERANDPYVFIRSAYRQNREFLIWDGNPPMDQDLYDEEFD